MTTPSADTETAIDRYLRCARIGNIEGLDAFIKDGGDIQALDEAGKTAAFLAAENGHVAAVKLLLASGVDPFAYSEGETILHAALHSGDPKTLRSVIQHAPRLLEEALGRETSRQLLKNCSSEAARDALLAAIEAAELDLRETPGASVPPRAKAPIRQTRLDRKLSDAIRSRATLEQVESLLDAGASPEHGELPPVLHACSAGRLDVLKLFLARGASLDARGDSAHTALTIASMHGRQSVVEYLVDECKIEISVCSDDGKSAVDYALDGCDIPRVRSTLTWLVRHASERAEAEGRPLGEIVGLAGPRLKRATSVAGVSRTR